MENKKMEDLVKDKDWQKVRESLLGQWKEKPEWCCLQLKNYLGNLKDSSLDQLKIVMNYLTGSGFRMGKIKHQCISILRKAISVEMKRRK